MKEITPSGLRCAAGAGCPAVFDAGEGRLLVVGTRVEAAAVGLADRVGPDEAVIEVPVELFEGAAPEE